ncbi:MAG: protein kinase [Planctomycetes bacterium]|nr:protein kinase [Planctomycetota bacterium]
MTRPFRERWEVIRGLGSGGQGEVLLMRDSRAIDPRPKLAIRVKDTLEVVLRSPDESSREAAFDDFIVCLRDIERSNAVENHYALKVLHQPTQARDSQNAAERLRREIDAMRRIEHSNLLKIVDADEGYLWYVSKYHQGGNLHDHLGDYAADLPSALTAFRGLVEGVARLHDQGIIHRDIKPKNIFLASDRRLVLGDFGLVYFSDDQHTRISNTLSNAGTRDFMPGWANGRRIEQLTPAFDVFSLGKVLWTMVSGRSFLNFWYYYTDEFNVETIHFVAEHMDLANELFSKCIVEHEADCLPNATELLAAVDNTLSRMKTGGGFGDGVARFCRVCGIGEYRLMADHDAQTALNFGISLSADFRLYMCRHCGHVDLFHVPDGERLNRWKNESRDPISKRKSSPN